MTDAMAQRDRSRKPLAGVSVYCRGCGRRGLANRRIVGRARTVDECSDCRKVEK